MTSSPHGKRPRRGHCPLFAREKKCCGHYFQRRFWPARSPEVRWRRRRMPAVRCFGTQRHSRRDRRGNHRARGQGSSLREGPVNTPSAHHGRFTRRGRSAKLYAPDLGRLDRPDQSPTTGGCFCAIAFVDFFTSRKKSVFLRRPIERVDSPFSVTRRRVCNFERQNRAIRNPWVPPIRINRDVQRRAGHRHADIWSECRERVQVEEFAPLYDFALRRIDIECKGGILCNLLFLFIGGRDGIEHRHADFQPAAGCSRGLSTNHLQRLADPFPDIPRHNPGTLNLS
jgi:hypothetical protein